MPIKQRNTDLPLVLLGAPVDIGSLVKTWVTVSCEATQDRDWQAALPGQDHMYPFGLIGVAPQYIPAGAVSELAGIRLGCISPPTSIRKKHICFSASLMPLELLFRLGHSKECSLYVCNKHPFTLKKHRRGESDSGSLIPWWF